MQLTEAQKQKFLEYVENKRLMLESKESVDDLATFCIKDIFKKAETIEFYKNSSEDKKLNFKVNVVQDILISFLKNMTNKILELDLDQNPDLDLTTALIQSQTLEEFFETINFYVAISPALSIEAFRYLAYAYTEKCTQLHLLADQEVLNILKD